MNNEAVENAPVMGTAEGAVEAYFSGGMTLKMDNRMALAAKALVFHRGIARMSCRSRSLALATFLSADTPDGFIDDPGYFICRQIGEGIADMVGGLIEQAPFDCILDEFRQCTPLYALRAKIGAHGQIGIL